jgi:hypothetical protein
MLAVKILAMRGPMNRQDGDGDENGEDYGQQGDDEPGGAFCGLGRGLGDAHGVDEGVRDEKEKIHGCASGSG